MEYSHKKRNALWRALYICLIVFGFFGYPLGEGIYKTLVSTISLISLVAGLYLLLKVEMTKITCIVKKRETDFDFYINRSMGKRGNYVCYYYVSDAVKIVKHTKEAVSEITKEYKNVGYYSFCHGLFSKDKYIILFKNIGYYDMIVVEMNEDFKRYLESCMACAVPTEEKNQSLHHDDDEKADTDNNESNTENITENDE